MKYRRTSSSCSLWVLPILLGLLSVGSAEARKSKEGAGLDPSRRPSEGKALIYFVRPENFAAAFTAKLFADGEPTGILSRKTFIAVEVDPGKHEFIGVAENAAFLDATVEANEIYYVQVAMHMGAWKARTHFEVCEEGTEAMDELQEHWNHLHVAHMTEDDREEFEDEAEEDQKKIKKYREKGEEFEFLTPDHGHAEPLRFE